MGLTTIAGSIMLSVLEPNERRSQQTFYIALGLLVDTEAPLVMPDRIDYHSNILLSCCICPDDKRVTLCDMLPIASQAACMDTGMLACSLILLTNSPRVIGAEPSAIHHNYLVLDAVTY